MQGVSRKSALFVGALMFFLQVFSVQATTTNIAGLWASGAGGTAGLPDLHYQLMQKPSGAPTSALITSLIPSSWMIAPTGSRWLSPVANANVAAPIGLYVYRLTFNLVDSGGHALDPSTASFTGHFAGDDDVTILFNGHAVSSTADSSSGDYGHLFSFTVNSGFVAGLNTLDFDVQNVMPGCSTPPPAC
jgi:hypothetical protein